MQNDYVDVMHRKQNIRFVTAFALSDLLPFAFKITRIVVSWFNFDQTHPHERAASMDLRGQVSKRPFDLKRWPERCVDLN